MKLASLSGDVATFSRVPQTKTETRSTGQINVPWKELLRWGNRVPPHRKPAVCLVDGSWFAGSIAFRLGDDSRLQLNVASDWLDVPPVAVEQVRGVVFQPQTSIDHWVAIESWMEQAKGSEDRVRLRDGTELAGVIDLNALSDWEAGGLRFKVGNREIELEAGEIEAIVFSPSLRSGVSALSYRAINFRDGTHVRCLDIKRGAVLQFRLVGGTLVKGFDAPEELLQQVVGCDQRLADVKWLLDQPRAYYRNVPVRGMTWPLGENRDVRGRSLIVAQENVVRGDKETGYVPRGIAMHSDSSVVFRHNGSAGRLLMEVRIAVAETQAILNRGNVKCRILFGRAGKLETARELTLSRTGLRSDLIELDLKDVTLIALFVDQAGFGPYGDELLFLDPRITRD